MILIKEEFVGGEKWRRAVKLGKTDAIAMWLALKCYACQHPASEGFVPDEDIDTLPGAPRAPRKALQALVECGRLLPSGGRSAGLVDAARGGWQLHDYLDHSATPEELELRREKARAKKQRQRQEQRRELDGLRAQGRDVPPGREGDMSPGQGGQTGDTGGDTEGDNGGDTAGAFGGRDEGDSPGDVPGTGLAGPGAPGPAPTRAGARPQPSPALSSPTHFSENSGSGSGRARERREPPSGSFARQDEPGIRGHERVDPQSDHQRLADEHGLDLETFVRKLRADPRSKTLGTVQWWAVLTKMLEKAAASRSKSLGGAA